MKIAYVLPSVVNKGSITIFKDIITYFISLDKDIIIDVYYFKEFDQLYFNYPNIRKISFFKKIPFREYDVIHSSGILPNFYIFLFGKKNASIYLTTIHSYLKQDLSNSLNKYLAILINNFWLKILVKQDCVAVLTNDAKKYYFNQIRTEIAVVNNGRDFGESNSNFIDDDINSILELKKRYTVIGSNAVVSKIKGLEQIILSLTHLKEYCFVLLGEGDEKNRLIELAKTLNVYDRCLFLGYKSNVFVYTYLYDVYLMPSRSEGFGLALIEAISLKIPCVCSNISVFNELFSCDEVLFFDLDNIEELALKIRILENQIIKNNYIAKAYSKYINFYTSEKMSQNYFDLYRYLMKKLCSQ